ncbi:MAG TPA: response regulator [Gaiellaceae bacterium]
MRRILVADDEPAIRQLYSIWLAGHGDDVRTAADGREAIALVGRGWIPDAAALDLDMPFVDGLSVCRYLHALDPSIRIVVVTGVEDARPKALDAGAIDVLHKPCSREALLGALHVHHAGDERPAQVAGVRLRVDPDAIGAGLRLE